MRGKKSLLRRILAVIISLLIILVITMVMLEIALRVFDPRGIYTAGINSRLLNREVEPHETGYRLPVGELSLLDHTVNINPDSTRYLPDTATTGDCTIAAIGDSFTFGQGVNDDETWVNLMAKAYADKGVMWLNTGRSAYNSVSVQRLAEYFEADGYIYLHIANDHHVIDWDSWIARWQDVFVWDTAFAFYQRIALGSQSYSAPVDMDAHATAIATLDAMDNVLIVALENDKLLPELPGDTLTIRRTLHTISPFDAHPSAAGHRQIAEDMLVGAEDFIADVCNL